MVYLMGSYLDGSVVTVPQDNRNHLGGQETKNRPRPLISRFLYAEMDNFSNLTVIVNSRDLGNSRNLSN